MFPLSQLLWRFPVLGQAVGDQKIHEIIVCWYPVHKMFLDLYKAPGAAENFRLKGLCVEYAVIYRCPGDQPPFAPSETPEKLGTDNPDQCPLWVISGHVRRKR